MWAHSKILGLLHLGTLHAALPWQMATLSMKGYVSTSQLSNRSRLPDAHREGLANHICAGFFAAFLSLSRCFILVVWKDPVQKQKWAWSEQWSFIVMTDLPALIVLDGLSCGFLESCWHLKNEYPINSSTEINELLETSAFSSLLTLGAFHRAAGFVTTLLMGSTNVALVGSISYLSQVLKSDLCQPPYLSYPCCSTVNLLSRRHNAQSTRAVHRSAGSTQHPCHPWEYHDQTLGCSPCHMSGRSLSLSVSNECILKLITENFADPSGSHLNLHLLSRGQQWAPPLHWEPKCGVSECQREKI